MRCSIHTVDAFTDTAYAGNPAAVCLLDAPRGDAWMIKVAREMNLSETAFVVKGDDAFSLRWRTPTVEVDLCGHATLASAHVIWELGDARDELAFDTRSGRLYARRSKDLIELDFPATPAEEVPLKDVPRDVVEGVGLASAFIGKTRFDWFVELASEDMVRSLRPDLARLATTGTRGVLVTAKSDTPGVDFVSRYFVPASGIDEDPVTGSTHCALGPYWSARLGRNELVGYQASSRGGFVRTRLRDDRVLLGGHAITILRGELLH